MTINQAKKLKWGTVLKPSQYQARQFPRKRFYRKAIFLGITRDGYSIKVIAFGTKTVEAWSPIFWHTENKVIGQ